MERLKLLRKDLNLWYSRLQPRGKAFFGVAVLGLVWLLFQLIWNIATRSPILVGWPALILNTIAGLFIGLVVAQFVVMRNMQRNYERNLRESLTKGRRGGNSAENIMGTRNRASMRSRGGNQMQNAMAMINQIDPDDLDKQYRPKLIAKPTLIAKWAEIEEAGIYALEEAPKAKVEIIEATELGGGFFVAKYAEKGVVKERRFMTHRQTGYPLRFDTLRNAKKALSGKTGAAGAKKRKPKKRR